MPLNAWEEKIQLKRILFAHADKIVDLQRKTNPPKAGIGLRKAKPWAGLQLEPNRGAPNGGRHTVGGQVAPHLPLFAPKNRLNREVCTST